MSVAAEMPGSRVDAALIAAYRAACYRVEAGFDLSIDRPSTALAAWQAGHGASSSALITACNPASQARSEQWNRAATRQLEAELLQRELAFSATVALDPQDSWPPETGFLVAGLAREPSAALARRLGQNALVFAGAEAVPRLILLR